MYVLPIIAILLFILTYILFCCPPKANSVFHEDTIESLNSSLTFSEEIPVMIKGMDDLYLSYNPKHKNFYTSKSPKVFYMSPNHFNKLGKNEVILRVKDNDENLYMNIICPNYAISNQLVSVSKSIKNSNILRVFNTKYGSCIKFYNEYYLSYDEDYTETLVASREHIRIFYFKITRAH